ncbi:hypothetical protein ACS0TY_006635 [Phlomoides rotata]
MPEDFSSAAAATAPVVATRKKKRNRVHVLFTLPMSPVKTTSPKKYCVRPNVGIIKPNSTYDFTEGMFRKNVDKIAELNKSSTCDDDYLSPDSSMHMRQVMWSDFAGGMKVEFCGILP